MGCFNITSQLLVNPSRLYNLLQNKNSNVRDTPRIPPLQDLKKENLRDHMTNLELVLNMLAEASTTEIYYLFTGSFFLWSTQYIPFTSACHLGIICTRIISSASSIAVTAQAI